MNSTQNSNMLDKLWIELSPDTEHRQKKEQTEKIHLKRSTMYSSQSVNPGVEGITTPTHTLAGSTSLAENNKPPAAVLADSNFENVDKGSQSSLESTEINVHPDQITLSGSVFFKMNLRSLATAIQNCISQSNFFSSDSQSEISTSTSVNASNSHNSFSSKFQPFKLFNKSRSGKSNSATPSKEKLPGSKSSSSLNMPIAADTINKNENYKIILELVFEGALDTYTFDLQAAISSSQNQGRSNKTFAKKISISPNDSKKSRNLVHECTVLWEREIPAEWTRNIHQLLNSNYYDDIDNEEFEIVEVPFSLPIPKFSQLVESVDLKYSSVKYNLTSQVSVSPSHRWYAACSLCSNDAKIVAWEETGDSTLNDGENVMSNHVQKELRYPFIKDTLPIVVERYRSRRWAGLSNNSLDSPSSILATTPTTADLSPSVRFSSMPEIEKVCIKPNDDSKKAPKLQLKFGIQRSMSTTTLAMDSAIGVKVAKGVTTNGFFDYALTIPKEGYISMSNIKFTLQLTPISKQSTTSPIILKASCFLMETQTYALQQIGSNNTATLGKNKDQTHTSKDISSSSAAAQNTTLITLIHSPSIIPVTAARSLPNFSFKKQVKPLLTPQPVLTYTPPYLHVTQRVSSIVEYPAPTVKPDGSDIVLMSFTLPYESDVVPDVKDGTVPEWSVEHSLKIELRLENGSVDKIEESIVLVAGVF